ncbi:MAG TPA: MCP four helix bundle domain-containing protein, partial [Burkholderiaceae bacterium]
MIPISTDISILMIRRLHCRTGRSARRKAPPHPARGPLPASAHSGTRPEVVATQVGDIMDTIRNWTIGTRLAFGFGALIALLVAMAVVGISKIEAVDANTNVIVKDRYVKIALASSIQDKVETRSRAIRTALIVTDPEVVKEEVAKAAATVPAIDEALAKLEATIRSPAGVAALKHAVEVRKPFVDASTRLAELALAGRRDEAAAVLVQTLIPAQNAYLNALQGLIESQVQGMQDFAADAEAQTRSAMIMMIVLATTAALLAAAIGFV